MRTVPIDTPIDTTPEMKSNGCLRSGMANTKAKGRQIGRPQTTKDSIPAIFLRHYPAYKSGQLNITELSRVCDLSRTTIYKYISLLEA